MSGNPQRTVFQPGDRVRLVDARPSLTKKRPPFPADVELVVDRAPDHGLHIGIKGFPGYWRAERFERVAG
jgi:hypothetical protein